MTSMDAKATKKAEAKAAKAAAKVAAKAEMMAAARANATIPDLASYDSIVVASSAGKDSQAMLDRVHELAVAAGVVDRIVVVHCDLGRVEWADTGELAAEQARRYDFRFLKVSRPQGDLLTHVEKLGQWPTPSMRFCTSDHKRAQIHRVITSLCDKVRKTTGKKVVRVLNAIGLRAEESPGRAKRADLTFDKRASNGRRVVDVWLPVHAWTTEEVWDRIRVSGVPHHRAYDLGMPRLSCAFCIFASQDALLLAGEHNRPLLDQYVALEAKIGHDFKHHLPIVQTRDALDRGERADPTKITGWCM